MKKMYMIGNAHLDPVWLWRWQEGFQETKATFRSALDRLREYDSFIFTSSSAVFYEWIENNEPMMFEEIKERIVEGRWVIAGGWWVQPDCNLPGGESFARHGLIGQRYFQEKFGVMAKAGYNVDSFGHHGMLPQILKQSGMDAYVFMRPGPDEKGLPGRLFLWESKDGSRVTSFRIPFEYTFFGNLENHVNNCKAELPYSNDHLMCFYGVGNHGGGPTKDNLNYLQSLEGKLDDVDVVLSSPNEFFEDVKSIENTLPVVHDDLQHHASGCYSVHSGIKQGNRQSENLILAAEKFSSIASWTTGQKYPEDYPAAWRGILFNQFHDILAGTSIEDAYEDARDLYGEAKSIASRGLNYALQSLSWNINIEQEEGMKPVVIFNPHSWNTKVNVEVETGIFGNYMFPKELAVENPNGNEVPYQFVKPHAKVPSRTRIAFMAELPPLGYAVYKIRPRKSILNMGQPAEHSDFIMENGRYKLEIDQETGGITSLFDKQKNVEVFRGTGALPVVIKDDSDAWGHGNLTFDDQEGTFKAVRIKKVETGPVKDVIRVTSSYGNSTIIQDFIMYKAKDMIEVKVKLNWQEKHRALKIQFPVNFDHRRVSYEIPFGTIERESNGEEESMQSWMDVTGTVNDKAGIYGLSILNDGKYSADAKGNVISLTVLRSPIFAHHAPYELDSEEDYDFIDHGIQKFTYALLPHENTWKEAGTVKRAAELNQPAQIVVESYHNGCLPLQSSFMQVDQENVFLSALNKAKDGNWLIARF